MNALTEIKIRFKSVLDNMVDDSSDLLTMIRPATDGKFGDYQVNCAMPLKNLLGKPPRDIAQQMIDQVTIEDLCKNVEVAGPGFINLTLDDAWLKERLSNAVNDDRLGVAPAKDVKTFVVDFSSPNVAKPMHVGHIRSTVIGDALAKILGFVGHKVITDNHLGDWGTQFGMIIYGYKHFVDQAAYDSNPVGELGRLYKFVRKIMDYHAAVKRSPEAKELLGKQKTALDKVTAEEPGDDKAAKKKQKKDIQNLNAKIKDQMELIESLDGKISEVESDPALKETAGGHPGISNDVLIETAKLHEGDEENKKLWDTFLPFCHEDIQRIYSRLNVTFDHEHGESFYHDMLGDVVSSLEAKGFARESEGATCVFMDDFATPMIIRKKDGAFLYATSDLATIKYRMDEWKPDAILYVVDHRQHEHFEKFFAAARLWGFEETEFTHVQFGTVLGEDGKPYKTRSGDTVGLEGLLDQAEERAKNIAAEQSPDLTPKELENIATVVGIGGLKYIDLSQNRNSDYKFSYDKMLALKGNTATYLQYSYARVQGIFRKAECDVAALRESNPGFKFEEDVERKLAISLIRFGETLDEVLMDYKPNLLASYLFDLTQVFFQFYDHPNCNVSKTEDKSLRDSRLLLCDLTARTIEKGLSLLGIGVVEKM